MDFSKITDKAKGLIARRGGTEGLKEDAQELKDIARGEGSLSDKAKQAAEVLKEPGAPGGATPTEPVRPTSAEPGPSGAGEPGAGEPGAGEPGAGEPAAGEPAGREPGPGESPGVDQPRPGAA